MTDTTDTDVFQTRAAAHAAAPLALRRAQRFMDGVNDYHVAAVMYAIENGLRLYRNSLGRWRAPTGSPLAGQGWVHLSTVVHEMIRTGLLRHVTIRTDVDASEDRLVPALVHLRDEDRQSACKFIGEDIGPMRSRLVDHLSLVDCLECEHVVATGTLRQL